MNSDKLQVECSWSVKNIREIPNKILWKEELGELTEESNIENCFEMIQPMENTHCTLKLTLKCNRKFAGIQVLSEVPVIEIYGEHEEYISTCKGELLDDVEGSSLYECRIQLKKLQSEILLKCCKLKEKRSLWIYGISVATKVAENLHEVPVSLKSLMLGMTPSRQLSVGDNPLIQLPGSLEGLISQRLKEMEERIISHVDLQMRELQVKIEEGNSKLAELISQINQKE